MTRAGVPFCSLGLVDKSTRRRTVPFAPIVVLRGRNSHCPSSNTFSLSQKSDSRKAITFASRRANTGITHIPRWLSKSDRSPFFFQKEMVTA